MAGPPLLTYNKPHASGLQRVTHLRALGLQVPRPRVAAKKIDAIGYERLRIYLLSRRDSNIINKPFLAGTSYQDILRIYDFDTKLRDICFVAVGQFEIHLRNSISERLSQAHGSHPYFESGAFKSQESQISCLQTFCSVYKKSRDKRAKHYRDKYIHPYLPPIWKMKEFLTFGNLSWIYKELSNSIRSDVASEFGVASENVFGNWVECLVDIRNICAHHDRLFNRSLQKQATRFVLANVPSSQTPNKKPKAILECLDYMMNHRKNPVQTVASVQKLLLKYPEVNQFEVGY